MSPKALERHATKPKRPSTKKPVRLDEDEDEGLMDVSDDIEASMVPVDTRSGLSKQVIRVPRLAVDPKVKKDAEKLKEQGLATLSNLGAVKSHTQLRRSHIIRWMLDGHTFDGALVSPAELAQKLDVPVETVERDLSVIKQQFSDLYTNPDTTNREMPAIAYMLLEMRMQDRGRALALYNEISADITEMKAPAEEGQGKKFRLSGRDLAAMRNAQLQALDVASKATQGLDSLFKTLGGPEKLTQLIKAKSVAISNGGVQNVQQLSMETLQERVGQMKEFRSVLPSTREKDQTQTPAFLDLSEEEEGVLRIGTAEHAKQAPRS